MKKIRHRDKRYKRIQYKIKKLEREKERRRRIEVFGTVWVELYDKNQK